MRASYNRRRLRSRRGVTLILTVFYITALIGMAAFAVDFGRMYMYKAELQATADGTALAAVVSLAGGAAATSVDSATRYAGLNLTGGSGTTVARADVLPGTWDGSFHQTNSDWVTGAPFAVQTTARYTGQYVFARLLGFSSKDLRATAIAVHGSVGREGCVRPWAVPYSSLLQQLGNGQPVSYNLTSSDVLALATATQANQIIMNAGAPEGTPGNVRAVRMGPAEYADGTIGSPNSPSASVYRSEIYETCDLLDPLIGAKGVGVGDWLQQTTGMQTGPTSQGVNDLLCATSPCSSAVAVNVAIYDYYMASTLAGVPNGAPDNVCGACFHVKYMGVFYVTGYDGTHGNNNVIGYFSSLGNPTGPFSATPGPVTKNALVK